RAEPIDGGADIVRDFGLVGDIGRDGQRLRRGGQAVDCSFQIGAPSIDGNDPRTALGQQADGGAADDAGGAGNDGNLAVQSNAIGHDVSSVAPVVPLAH